MIGYSGVRDVSLYQHQRQHKARRYTECLHQAVHQFFKAGNNVAAQDITDGIGNGNSRYEHHDITD